MGRRTVSLAGVTMVLVLAALTSVPVAADTLHLTDGRIVEGTIVSTTDTLVTIATASGVREYPVMSIVTIERSPENTTPRDTSVSIPEDSGGTPSEAHVGIGVESLGGLALLSVQVGFNGLAGDLSLGWRSANGSYESTSYDATIILFESHLMYCLPLAGKTLAAYAGAGIDGVAMSFTYYDAWYGSFAMSGLGIGASARMGLQLDLYPLGVPVALLAGVSWLSLGSVTVSGDGGYSDTIPVDQSGFLWHVAIMFVF